MSTNKIIADPAELDMEFSISNLPNFILRRNDSKDSKEKFQFYIYYKDSNGRRSNKIRINTGECDIDKAKESAYKLLCMFKEDPSTILTYKNKGSGETANSCQVNWLNQPFYKTLAHVFQHNLEVRDLESTGDYYSAFNTLMIPYFKYQHPDLLTKNVDIGVVQRMFDIMVGIMCPNIEQCNGCSYVKGKNKLPCSNDENICMKRIMFDKERELNKNGKPINTKYNVLKGDSIKHLKTYLNMTFKYVNDRVLGKDGDMMLFRNNVSDINEHLKINARSEKRACLEALDIEKIRALLLSDIMTDNVEDSQFELVTLYLCLAFGLRIGEAATVKLSNINLTDNYVRLENYISIEGTRKDTKRNGSNTIPHLKGISSNHVVISIKDETQSGIKKIHKRIVYVIDENIFKELKALIEYKKRIEREMCVEVESVNPDGYLCVYNDGSVLARVDGLRNMFKNFLKKHDIHLFDKVSGNSRDKAFVPHSLRHSFITLLEIFDNHGFTTAAIRKMTAHSADSDAHDIYIHQRSERGEYGAEEDQMLLKKVEDKFNQRGTEKAVVLPEQSEGMVENTNKLLESLLSTFSKEQLLEIILKKVI